MIRQPSEKNPQEKQKHQGACREEKIKERTALQEQSPFNVLIPGGKKPVQQGSNVESFKRKSGQADVRIAFIRIFRQIMRDVHGGLPKNFRILEILSG